jgi:hypothetical protein
MRLYDWNTKPRWRLRTSDNSSSSSSLVSSPRTRYTPDVGRSMQPSRLSSVDLPEPELPITAQYSPCRNVNEKSSSACTSCVPMR